MPLGEASFFVSFFFPEAELFLGVFLSFHFSSVFLQGSGISVQHSPICVCLFLFIQMLGSLSKFRQKTTPIYEARVKKKHDF